MTAGVRGRVEVALRPGAIGRQVRSGEPVYLGNAVSSGPDSGMQIVLLDETTFTIGPDSELVIDEFVYDPRSSAGKVGASIAKGVFRFVTGKVARENPEAMRIKLPSGTIGIRGTIALGRVDQVEQNGLQVNRQQVILVGPGYDTDSNRRGGIDLFFDGQHITIWRPGWGSTLMGDGQWGPAEHFPPALIQEVLRLLQARGEPLGNPNADDIRNAGDSLFDGRRVVSWVNGTQQSLAWWDSLNQQASLPERTEIGGFGISDGLADFADLRRVTSGQFNYNQAGVTALTPGGAAVGGYSLFLNIDFGARTVGGGDSRITLNTPIAGGTSYLGTLPFGNSPAIFDYSGLSGMIGTGCGSSQTCTTSLTASAINQGGVAGAQLLHALTVLSDGGAAVLGGTGFAGLSPGFTVDPVPYTDGTSSLQQLRTLSSGQFYYTQSGVPLNFTLGGAPAGSYDLFLNIDFGARTIGGGNSRAEIVVPDAGLTGTALFGTPQSFAAGAGAASFQFSSTYTGGCAFGCQAQLSAQPQNQSGVVAQSLSHTLAVSNSGVLTATGGGTTNGRVPGFAPAGGP
ncbi:MAG: FecR family protein [Alphaproteobacteria bacterium]|nr:FecR family protein [Alphaproteobacteria bacterium]